MKTRLWFKLSIPMYRDQIPRETLIIKSHPRDGEDVKCPGYLIDTKLSSMHEFINLVTRSFREERESSSVKGFWEIIRLASQKDLTKGGKIISYPASNDKDFRHAHWEKPIDRISVEFPEKKPTFIPQHPFTVVLCSLILQRCIRNYYSLLLYSRNSNVNAPPRVKGGGGERALKESFGKGVLKPWPCLKQNSLFRYPA